MQARSQARRAESLGARCAAASSRDATRRPAAAAAGLGNQATQQASRAGRPSAPRVGRADDSAEVEANQIADRVLSPAFAGSGLGAATPEPGGPLRRSPEAAAPAQATAVGAVARAPGAPLSQSERAFFEPRLGGDFSSVRLHQDAAADQAARSLGAHAFTLGPHIAFAAGAFQPGTASGRRCWRTNWSKACRTEPAARSVASPRPASPPLRASRPLCRS